MKFNNVLAEAFARHAQAPALLTQDGQILTFERLERTVGVLATRLRDEGVDSGQCVAVLTDNNALRIAFFLALARLGAEVAFVQSPGPLIACGQKIDAAIRFADQSAGGIPRSIVFSQDWLSGAPDPALQMHEARKVILSTSGSTGAPRFIKLHPQSWLDIQPLLADGFGPSIGSVMTSIPVTAPFSNYMMTRAFASGHGFSGMRPTGEETLKEAARFGLRELIVTPLALAELVSAAEGGAPRGALARIVVFGAIAEGVLLSRAENAFGCPVYACNGASEISQTSFGRFDAKTYITGWCGWPSANIPIRVGEDKGAPSGESGRVYVSARKEWWAEGYLGAPPVYDADGWFDTGDIGRLQPDGSLVIEGRADNLINLGGSKYAAERIEALVAQCPGVVVCAATRLDPPGGMAPELGIVVVAGPSFDADGTRTHVAAKLRTATKIRVAVCERLPMLPAGKIDRAALRALFVA